MAFVEEKHNVEISWNEYPIFIYQGSSSHELYFIIIDNWGQAIISPNKKIMETHIVRKLEVLIWFMRIWMLKTGYCYDQCLIFLAWTRIKGNDNMISYAEVVSVSTSCSRYYVLTFTSCCMIYFISYTVDIILMVYLYI